MAKNGKTKTIIWIIGLSLTAIGMLIAGALAYGDTSNRTETNAVAITVVEKEVEKQEESVKIGFKYMAEHQNKELAEIKKDGCDPAVQARTDIAVI